MFKIGKNNFTEEQVQRAMKATIQLLNESDDDEVHEIVSAMFAQWIAENTNAAVGLMNVAFRACEVVGAYAPVSFQLDEPTKEQAHLGRTVLALATALTECGLLQLESVSKVPGTGEHPGNDKLN